jgi:phage terminase large subunit
LEDQIEQMGLNSLFNITNNEITNKIGSRFIFTGLHNNITKIKSLEGIDLCWVEEGETISEYSWSILIPTIRKPGSQIIISFNPFQEDDPTYQRFIINTPPRSAVVDLNWRDNKWISQETIEEKDYLQKVDPDSYEWVWEGQFMKRSKAQIFFDKCRVDYVKPQGDWGIPLYGTDWGFSNDPLRMVKCWVHERKLYVEKEADGIGVDIDKIPSLLLKTDPICNRYPMRADNARPEIISYLRQNGFPKIIGCKKGPGSIEQGITFIRSFEEIIIDPSCKGLIEESKMYKYKTDRLTGEVLPDIIDKFNHSWDAVRYALEPLMPNKQPGKISFTKG